MDLTSFQFTEIQPELFVYRGAVNTGILKWGDRALLVDCDDTLTPGRLAELGIQQVERIYCTQHRRPNTAGARGFEAPVFAPLGERAAFEEASAYWRAWKNRWHLYHFNPGPLAPLEDIPLAGTVAGGESFQWGGWSVTVLDTPGMTGGAVSYRVEREGAGQRVIFCGDALYGPGQVWDLHSLQNEMGGYSDYHGFLGRARELVASLGRLAEDGADCLAPSHGAIIADPAAACALTAARLERLYRSWAAVSSLNHYFPHIYADLQDDPRRMAPAQAAPFPAFVEPVWGTSFAIRSESGALFLVDCGDDSVLETLRAWKEQGRYTALEGCWVTHYHDDHVDSLHHLAGFEDPPILADEHLAEIVEHPGRFYLPCLSPASAPVARATTHGETWSWREFELTALHFPGQTFYHGGLLVRGHGQSVLLCGDSFSPAGLDDYTAGNRNLVGAGQGYRRCIELVRQYRPDWILNQHIQQAWRFSDAQLDDMESILAERASMLAELLPWEHPNYGVDSGWLRAYPYEVEARAGGRCALEVRAANYTRRPVKLAAEVVPPAGWNMPAGWKQDAAAESFEIDDKGEKITCAPVEIAIPAGTAPGTYPVAFRVSWGGRYLGQACHALVRVW